MTTNCILNLIKVCWEIVNRCLLPLAAEIGLGHRALNFWWQHFKNPALTNNKANINVDQHFNIDTKNHFCL